MRHHIIVITSLFLCFISIKPKNMGTAQSNRQAKLVSNVTQPKPTISQTEPKVSSKTKPTQPTYSTIPSNDITSLYNWFLSRTDWNPMDEQYFQDKQSQFTPAQKTKLFDKRGALIQEQSQYIPSKPSTAANPIVQPNIQPTTIPQTSKTQTNSPTKPSINAPTNPINKAINPSTNIIVQSNINDPFIWQQISMPYIFAAPYTNKVEINGDLYSFSPSKTNEGGPNRAAVTLPNAQSFKITFPTYKMDWFLYDEPCTKKTNGEFDFASTQTRLTSEYIQHIYGLSFLGSIKNKQIGPSQENHFAIFFHAKDFRCFKGGPEYGLAFYENGKVALFYLCGNCNLKAEGLEKWWDWPGLKGQNIGNQNVNDPENKVSAILQDPSQEYYYNIKVTPEGNFIIEMIHPKTWQKAECTIKKPDWFPNVYGMGGYITVNAKRNDDSTTNMGTFELKEIKVLQKK